MSDPFDAGFEKYLDFGFDDGSEEAYEDYFWFVEPSEWGKFKWFDMMSTVAQMPPNASRGLRFWYKMYVMSQIATLCCPSCKGHALNYYRSKPISIDQEAKDALSLFRWVYDMREFVNDRKGVPKNKRVSFEKACAFYKVVGSSGFVPVAIQKKKVVVAKVQEPVPVAKPKPEPIVVPQAPAVVPVQQRAIVMQTVAKPSPFGRVGAPTRIAKVVYKAAPAPKKAVAKAAAPKKAAAAPPAKRAAPKKAAAPTTKIVLLPPKPGTVLATQDYQKNRLTALLGAINKVRSSPRLTAR